MGSWPTKARPTWAGVVLVERTGERVVPWLDALHHSTVMVDGKPRRFEFKRLRDGTLADAHRKRAIRHALRTGATIKWRHPLLPSPAGQRLELALGLAGAVGIGSLGVLVGVVALGKDAMRFTADVPFTIVAFMWGGLTLLTLGPVVLSVLAIRGILALHRTRVVAVEVDRDRWTAVRRSSSVTVAASEVRSLTPSFAARALLTASGERVPLGTIPSVIVEAWLERSSPGLVGQHDRTQARMMRRTAVVLLLGMIACVLLAWWLERYCGLLDHRERPNILAALFIVPIYPGLMWWASTREGSRKPARR